MNKAMKQGFTLIELMVVVIIVGILAAVAIPKMSANKDRAIASEAVAALGSLNTAAKMYEVATGTALADGDTPSAMITAGYVTATDLEGTYFTSTQIQTAVWDLANKKFESPAAGFSDTKANLHIITWDGTANSYFSKKG